MQSKVILFCTVLFCSQIVDSISRLENSLRYKKKWHLVDQNAQNADYNDYTPTRNVKTLPNPAIDPASSQNYYSDQRLYIDNDNFNNIPVGLSLGSTSHGSLNPVLPAAVSDLQEDGGSLDNNPLIESHPTQDEFQHKQFRNKNWQPESKFTNFASNSVPISIDNGSPSVNPVQEPYGLPHQYFAPTNRQAYQPGSSFLTRQPFQSLAHNGDSFVANSRFGLSGQERPYKKYMTRSDLHASNYDGNFPVISEGNNYNTDAGSNNDSESYNEEKATTFKIKAAVNADRRSAKRIGSQLVPNYPSGIGTYTSGDQSRNIFSDTELSHYDDEMFVPDKYRTGSIPSNVPVSYERIGENHAAELEAKPRPKGGRRPAQKIPAQLNIEKKADDIINTLSDTVLDRKYAEMKDINLKSLVTQTEMEKMLAESDSRYIIIHPNGTFENVNKINLDSHKNPRLRLVNTKLKNVADTDGDGTQSPDNLHNIIVHRDESSLLTNNQPAHVNQTNPAEESDSNLSNDLPGVQSNLNPLTPLVNQPGEVNDTNSSSPRENKPAVDKTTLPSNVNQPGDYNTFNQLHPLKRHTHRNKLKHSHGNQPTNDNVSRPSSGDNNSQLLPSKKNHSTVRHQNRRPKPSQINPPSEGGNDSRLERKNPGKNQLSDATNSEPLKEFQSENDSISKPTGESQQGDDNKSPKSKPNHHIKPNPSPINQLADVDTSHENIPGVNNNSHSLSVDENQTEGKNRPEDDKTSKPLRQKQSTVDSKLTLPGVSEPDEQSDSTTFSPTASNDTTSPKPKERIYRHHKQKSTTSSPIVHSTTPSSEKTSEDQINTLSAIEQVTDNVSDVQPVTTTTTTAKPIENLGKTDTTKDANNKQDYEQEDASSSSEDFDSTLDTFQTSTTTASPISSTTPTDITTDDKTTKETAESKDTQTNDKAIKSQGNNGKNEIKTGLSGNDKTLVVSIDTDNDDDDDTKTTKSSGSGSQSSDCNKDQDDGRGRNLEIDMSNIQGEPTIWIRTTNQDFIDKLTDKNDTSFDIVYFFNNVNQPAIERVKETTIHCNGTVVIESKDITYANKDDPTPTITKTTQTIQIEDYKRFGLDLS